MNLYEQLGLGPDATAAEIKQAYRRLAQEHHPDRNNGDGATFLPIQAAYDVLGDQRRRAKYDQTGATDNNNFEQQVDDKLMQLFNGMLAEERDVRGNAVDQMREMINNGINDTDDNRGKVERRKARLGKRRNRIKTKKSRNLYLQLVDQQITQCDQQIAQLGEEIDLLAEVLNRLDDYEDVEPVVAPKQYTSFYVGSTSTMP